MSSTETDGDARPRREVAHRIFAAEFDDATLSYSESDEERAPNYVVTPTGARANRLFVAGVLTELDELGNGQLRARIVDPTGAFVVYAGQYQPDALAALERLSVPAFVAVTGKARTFQPEDSDRVFTSIRPESINEIDATIRDRWTVETAARTLDRVSRFAAALGEGDVEEQAVGRETERDGPESGITLAREHYGTTPAYLSAVHELALDAARLVAGDVDELDTLAIAPDAAGEGDLDALAGRSVEGTVATLAKGSDSSRSDIEAPTGAGSEDEGSGTDPVSTPGSEVETPGSFEESGSEPKPEAETADDRSVSAETPESDAPADIDDSAVTAADDPDRRAAGSGVTGSSAAGTSIDETDSDDGFDDGVGVGDEDGIEGTEEFEGEFELSEDERAEIEAEYGTDFATGSEVDAPGEADIEPDVSPTAENEAERPAAEAVASDEEVSGTEVETAETETDTTETEVASGTGIEAERELESEPDSTSEPAPVDSTPDVESTSADDVVTTDVSADEEPGSIDTEAGGTDSSTAEGPDGIETTDEDESDDGEATDTDVTIDDTVGIDDADGSEDIDVSETVMDAMRDLDDGNGADRNALIERVTAEYGVGEDEVRDAIQDALMSGRCYEPGDGKLKAI